jgi:hypothetical protein
MKEFMDSVLDHVGFIDGKTKTVQKIHKNDGIFTFTVEDFINALNNSSEFMECPTREVMKKVCQKEVDNCIKNFKQLAGWYIDEAMPMFMVNELKVYLDCPDKAKCIEIKRDCPICDKCEAPIHQIKPGCDGCQCCVFRKDKRL